LYLMFALLGQTPLLCFLVLPRRLRLLRRNHRRGGKLVGSTRGDVCLDVL
jgi:hypothetical protein